MSPNSSLKPVLKKMTPNKNKFEDKSIYKYCRQNKTWETSTACINPQTVWRETRSPLGSGNELMPDPKSQQIDTETPIKLQHKRKYKRTQTSMLQRKANRKAKRTEQRRTYRQLRKCHPDPATQDETYHVAQECLSNKTHNQTMNAKTSTVQGPQKIVDNLPKFRPVNVKLATLNLNEAASQHPPRHV